jgi:hypothetical protein
MGVKSGRVGFESLWALKIGVEGRMGVKDSDRKVGVKGKD